MVFILILGLILRFELKGLGRPGGMMPSYSKRIPSFPLPVLEKILLKFFHVSDDIEQFEGVLFCHLFFVRLIMLTDGGIHNPGL